jgi:hypothetical protein
MKKKKKQKLSKAEAFIKKIEKTDPIHAEYLKRNKNRGLPTNNIEFAGDEEAIYCRIKDPSKTTQADIEFIEYFVETNAELLRLYELKTGKKFVE